MIEVIKVGETYSVSDPYISFPAKVIHTGLYDRKPIVILQTGTDMYVGEPELCFGKGNSVQLVIRIKDTRRFKSVEEIKERYTYKIGVQLFENPKTW